MAETVEETRQVVEEVSKAPLCLCEQYARVTERAALAGARWLGRADQHAAEEAATAGMRAALDGFPISGRIVIGAAEEDSLLHVGEEIGAGGA